MAIHSVDTLMEQTRHLAGEYYRNTGQILPVTLELSRYDAMRLLHLEKSPTKRMGVDAVGSGARAGRLLQIKGRVLFQGNAANYRIGQINNDGTWDSLLLVLFDASYHPTSIYECPRETIKLQLSSTNPKRSKRGAMSVAKFIAISTLVWTPQEGEVNT